MLIMNFAPRWRAREDNISSNRLRPMPMNPCPDERAGPVNMDVDIVPMGEFVANDLTGNGVVGHQILDRLV